MSKEELAQGPLVKKKIKILIIGIWVTFLIFSLFYGYRVFKKQSSFLSDRDATGGGDYTFAKRVATTSSIDFLKGLRAISSLETGSNNKIYNTAQITVSYGGIIKKVYFEKDSGNGGEVAGLTLNIESTDKERKEFSINFDSNEVERLEIYRRDINGPIILQPEDLSVGQTINITKVTNLLSSEKRDLLIIDVEEKSP